MSHPGLGKRQGHPFLGPGHGHIEQSPLFLDFIFRGQPSARRKEILLHSGNENIGEFQSFGSVDGHQCNPVCRFFVAHVSSAYKAHVLKIIAQSHQRVVFSFEFVRRGNPLFCNLVLNIFPVPVLNKQFHRVEQLFEVGKSGLALNGGVGFQGLP